MSDEDRDVDIESDEDDDDDVDQAGGSQHFSQADKRAHHNALERKRRDHIKDSFHTLRDSVPELLGEKVSRAHILKKASEYIHRMREKNNVTQHDIDGIKRENKLILQQIDYLENYSTSPVAISSLSEGVENSVPQASGYSSQDIDDSGKVRRKRQKL